jgi:hypothetical protein
MVDHVCPDVPVEPRLPQLPQVRWCQRWLYAGPLLRTEMQTVQSVYGAKCCLWNTKVVRRAGPCIANLERKSGAGKGQVSQRVRNKRTGCCHSNPL